MPVPMMNIINGGAHADNNVDFQEFMILPVGAPSFAEALRYGAEVFHALKKVLQRAEARHRGRRRGRLRARPAVQRGGARDDPRGHREGRLQAGQGYLPRARRRELRVLQGRQYDSKSEGRSFSAAAVRRLPRAAWLTRYPIITIEDGMAEDDWDGWALLTRELGKQRAAGRRRPVRHQHRDLRTKASTGGSPTPS